MPNRSSTALTRYPTTTVATSPREFFARRKLDAAARLERYAADAALDTARRRLQNVDLFTALRMRQGAGLAMMAAEQVATIPLSQMCVQTALLERESAASQIMLDHLVR